MVTIRELAEFVAEETSAKIYFPIEPHHGEIYLPDNQETKDKLGVIEGVNWEIAVQEMIDFEGKKRHGTF
jgi:hypothetical protein